MLGSCFETKQPAPPCLCCGLHAAEAMTKVVGTGCAAAWMKAPALFCRVLQVVEAVLQVVSTGCAAAPEALQLLGPALQLILRAGVPVQRPDLESLDGDGVSQPLPNTHFVRTRF